MDVGIVIFVVKIYRNRYIFGSMWIIILIMFSLFKSIDVVYVFYMELNVIL